MAGQSCCGGASSARGKKQTDCCGTAGAPRFRTVGKRANCCGEPAEEPSGRQQDECQCQPVQPARWITGAVSTPVGDVPQVPAKLSFLDVYGSWKCRWGIGRMDYAVEPGLYCVGTPNAQSPVLVTANYKMTFDRLRMELAGLDAWIVVLDTDGVNVWCAAGKGTFGTEELIHRLGAVRLGEIVSHRTIILPQLGATGVAAHEVAKRSGFHVVYGPVRASDLGAFLAAGMQATEGMRKVRFTLWDRLVLTPVEAVGAIKPVLVALGVLFLLNAIGFGHYGLTDLWAVLGALVIGCVLTPVLLPWIPGRAFSFKGALLGLLWAVGVNVLNGFPLAPEYGWWKATAYLLILPALSAFWAMNFTGSSTYTSLSGVDKEMRIALPTMLLSSGVGVLLLLINDFVLMFG